MRYKDGIPDYESLTPEEARDELFHTLPVYVAAVASHDDWGGDFEAHLNAQREHQDRLWAIAARTTTEAAPC